MANFEITTKELEADIDEAIHSRSASDRTLVITGKPGYVVSKDDFTVPGSLPTHVTGITLTDTGTAGEPDNTVQVLVAIDSSYEAAVDDNVISLGITGDAVLYNKPPEGAETVNVGFSLGLTFEDTECSVTKTTESGVTASGDTLSGTAKAGELKHLATYTVTANTNKYFKTMCSTELVSNMDINNGTAFFDITTITRDGNNFITAFVFKVSYLSKTAYTASDDLKYKIVNTAIAKPTATVQIKKVDYGRNQVYRDGETRNVRVYGDVGAKFDIQVKPNGGSNFVNETDVEIPKSGFHRAGMHYKDVSVVFPKSASTITYDLIIAAGTASTLNSTTVGSSPVTFTINQVLDPTLTFSATGPGSANYSDPADITKKGIANSSGSRFSHIRDLVNFKINYSITTTDSSIAITKVPQFRVLEITGEVKSANMDRLYISTDGLETGMKIVEHSNDTSLPARNISSINSTDGYVVASVNFAAAGTKKKFTLVKSDFTEASIVPHLNGGSRVSITNIAATAVGQTATITADVTIVDFGNANKTIDLDLSNILNETP